MSTKKDDSDLWPEESVTKSKQKQEVPTYAITMANTKTGLSISAGSDDIKLFNKTDLTEFIAHFYQQDRKLNNPIKQIVKGEIVVKKRKDLKNAKQKG